MSTPSSPYGQVAGHPLPPRPQKYRPSAGWMVLGLGLYVVGVLVAVATFVWLLVGLFDVDTLVEADGTTTVVDVSTDRDRMLWMDSTTQQCTVVDRDSGQRIPLQSVDGQFTRSDGNGDFEGLQRFSPGSGHLAITCTQTDGTAPGEVLVSAYPRLGSAIPGVVLGIVLPGALALVGLVVVLWVGVLWSLRPPRPRRA